ncbi:MAG: SAM-dependent methyltransferase [Bacteroidales bacterium]|nr:SAM-dependent methyltransferase [Bacteroidales bacterium]
MENTDFKSLLGLERSVSLSSNEQLTDSQLSIVQQVEGFGIDEVYFSTDESKSYPAVFIKKVVSFDESTCSEISLIQQKLWNFQKVLFLYVFNDVEIRVYNCIAKPITRLQNGGYVSKLKRLELFRAESTDEEAISCLVSVFSAMAIDSGIIWTMPEVAEIRKKINIQSRVDKYLVDSLKDTTDKLKKLGLDDLAIIHKIILRSLFLLYLEDRGATDAEFYGKIKAGADKYFDILKDVDATYRLYAILEDRFNGNVFSVLEGERQKVSEEHLKIVRKCFINGYKNDGQTELFDDWRLFDFKIIRIELLSEIYERFLEESNPKGKKGAGAYYTPTSLVELMLDEILPVGQQYNNYNVKILDPACGSGIFLVESYKRLLKRYENAHGRKPTELEELERILLDNIYGIEKNDQAIIVAAFSLYLALVDNLDPKTLWISTKLPCLVNDPDHIRQDKNGNNLFCRDTIKDNEDIESISFDLVVGNPPFGTENKSKGVVLSDSIRDYCNKNRFAKEMVLPFLHKAIKFSPKGKVAMIFNTKLLTNTGSTYKSFRGWLFNDCYVEKVYNFSILRNAHKNFGGQLFDSAIGPICIAFYQQECPVEKSDRIVYYAPKTYIKSNVLEGIVIDSSDVKYLPREECRKPNTKIWKVAMWGGDRDFDFINSGLKNHISLSQYLDKNSFIFGVGFETSSPADKSCDLIPKLPIHRPKNTDAYSTDIPLKSVVTNKFRRLGMLEVYQKNHVIFNEGIKVGEDDCLQLVSSYVDYQSAYVKGIVGIASLKNDDNALKLLTLFLNSSYVLYYAFLATSSWGIERDIVKYKELFQIRYVFDQLDQNDIEYLLNCFDEIIEAKKNWLEIAQIRLKVNDFIFDKIGSDNAMLIKDALLKIDLFQKQENSTALLPIQRVDDYIEQLCLTLSNFIGCQGLWANGTTYKIQRDSPLAMIKITFEKEKHDIQQSISDIQNELSVIDKHLWEEKGSGIYFRKKLNYYEGDSIYIIRPNQRHFWTQSMAMQDASDLIIEILNHKEG